MSKFRGRRKRWKRKLYRLIWKGATKQLPPNIVRLRRRPGSVKLGSKLNIPRRSIMNEFKADAKRLHMTIRQFMEQYGQHEWEAKREKVYREYGFRRSNEGV